MHMYTHFACTQLHTLCIEFIYVPETLNVSNGTTGIFRCMHTSADTIRWKRDGILIGLDPPSDITPGTQRDEDGNLVNTLSIMARLGYNGTEIECVAQFDDNTPDATTDPAILLGELSMLIMLCTVI